jgi:isocitrate dehydrogenase kinase/phosphatase
MATPILQEDAPEIAASLILDAYEHYQRMFLDITRRARERFIAKEWANSRLDILERLDLYSEIVRKTVTELQKTMGPMLHKETIGIPMKMHFSKLVALREDTELAETFFNSITRKIFTIVGMIPSIEFTTPDFKIPMFEERLCYICRSHLLPENSFSYKKTFEKLLSDYREALQLTNFEQDAGLCAWVVQKHLENTYNTYRMDFIEVNESVFYRQKAAYIIGRIRSNTHMIPLVIAFLNDDRRGVHADAVLLSERSSSIIFGFTRSYFQVIVRRPSEMINFLKSIMPRKRVSELYTSIGFNKHGKSELFRELTRSLSNTDDNFEIASGEKGMVMLVFTLPSFDVVFKIIKDHFEYPKKSHRQAVRDKYRLVFRHNRAGRLVDAQVFEYLEFDRNRFTEDLLDEFRKYAQETVFITDTTVTIRHLFTERRIRPLDLYLKEADENQAIEVILDYGRAIKELAVCNIFPGDLFLKNFGVTRHGRVVFYDYDELCLVTECNFRNIPKSRGYDDELSSEPWYFIGEDDVFPEEFRTFLNLPDHLRDIFEQYHGDLYTIDFWNAIKERLLNGEVIHVFPYDQNKRFINMGI